MAAARPEHPSPSSPIPESRSLEPPDLVLAPDDGRPATPPSDLIEIQVVKVTDTSLVPEPPEPGSFHCALCPAAFRLVSELLFHEHGHLAGADGGGQGGDPSRCHVCGHSCPGPASLRAHYSLHTGERPYRCPLCPRAFKALAPLLRHQHRHGLEPGTSRRPPQAAAAGKPSVAGGPEETVATPAAAPRVPFHCSECGKSFRYRSDLRRHFARHTALKPHACPRCGKGFKHSFNLANHLRSHTGERPYRCSACPKGFRDSTGLLHHQVSLQAHTARTGLRGSRSRPVHLFPPIENFSFPPSAHHTHTTC
uniref:Flt3-interacting zinc finger protein 1 n=1 Tax=Marmota marmota marmota TaxID=9994 RepID=A0A8C5YLX7_MARMA